MSNLAYIEELGIGVNPESSDTEATSNDQEAQQDLSLASEGKTPDNTKDETEVNGDIKSLLESYKNQISGMEKRIADKDAYINELREASKQKEANQKQEVDTKDSEDDDFWNDPDKTIKSLKQELEEHRRTLKIQQLQTMEIHYANTVNDYWATVNPDALKEAVLMDEAFAQEFNNSKEPYKIAYEYLKNKTENKSKEANALREQIRKELLAELGVKEGKTEVPPHINNGGKSSSQTKTVPEDGFAAVFGSSY